MHGILRILLSFPRETAVSLRVFLFFFPGVSLIYIVTAKKFLFINSVISKAFFFFRKKMLVNNIFSFIFFCVCQKRPTKENSLFAHLNKKSFILKTLIVCCVYSLIFIWKNTNQVIGFLILVFFFLKNKTQLQLRRQSSHSTFRRIYLLFLLFLFFPLSGVLVASCSTLTALVFNRLFSSVQFVILAHRTWATFLFTMDVAILKIIRDITC